MGVQYQVAALAGIVAMVRAVQPSGQTAPDGSLLPFPPSPCDFSDLREEMKFVKRFDKDGDYVLNAAERKSVATFSNRPEAEDRRGFGRGST